MSELKIDCPHCKQSLEIPEELLGQTVECPTCNGSIQLPQKKQVVESVAQPKPTQEILHTETKDCPYCGETILAHAKKCKHCNEILDPSLKQQRQKQSHIPSSTSNIAQQKSVQEKTEYESHPAMFRNSPVGFILTVILCFAGIGLVIFLIWWLRCLGTTLTITNKKTILRKGILSKHTNEVRHSDVRNVQINQGIFQRMCGVGTVGIASAGSGGIEITVSGIPKPAKIKDIIDKYRDN